jgi:hypothetical protein
MKNYHKLQTILKDNPIEISLKSIQQRQVSFNEKSKKLEISFPFDSDKLTHELGHIAEITAKRLLIPNLGFGDFFDDREIIPAKKLGAVCREMKVFCYERNLGKALDLDLKIDSDDMVIYGMWNLIEEFPFPDKHLIPGATSLEQEFWVQNQMSEYLKEYSFDHFMNNFQKNMNFLRSLK